MTNPPTKSSLYTYVVSNYIFPLHEWYKKHSTTRVFRSMDQSQWWDPQRLLAYQNQRLQELITYASTKVPYYRNLFAEHGIQPDTIKSAQDLNQIPFLTKQVIKENLQDLKSEEAQHLKRFNTGGSSGEPLIFYIDNERISHDVAAKWRATRWWGVDIGDPEIVFWGSPIELGAQDRVRLLRDKLLRSTLLEAFSMSEQMLAKFVTTIRRIRPKMLFGYPSAISYIANYAAKHGHRMDDLGIKVVFVTSERLYDHQRQTIEKVFACPVANGYGGRDAGFIAHACPHNNMHITAEDIVVEIVDSQGNVLPRGKTGEIVVTHLATKMFPFVRYRTGDIGTLDDELCPCGRGLPLLKDIQGRTTDFIVASDGTVMHGLALIYVLRDIAGIQEFKIVQESLNETRVLLVTNPNFQERDQQTIQDEFKKRLGQNISITIEHVNTIEAEASGKFRYVISKVTPN